MNDRARIEIQADLAALAGRRRRRLGLGVLLGSGLTAAAGLVRGPAGEIGSPLLFGGLLVALCVLGALALALAFGVWFPRRAVLRRAVVVGLAASLAALAGMSTEAHAVGGPGAMCLGEGTAMTFGVLMALLWLGRGGLARRHGPVGPLLGLAAALAGVGVLQVLCPDRSLGHLLLWHGGVLFTGVLLASLLHRILPGPEDGPGEGA